MYVLCSPVIITEYCIDSNRYSLNRAVTNEGLGLTEAELEEYFPGPAFLGWSLLTGITMLCSALFPRLPLIGVTIAVWGIALRMSDLSVW